MSKKADDAISRFAHEFGRLGGVHKQGIVYISGTDDARVAMLMPCLEAKSLRRSMGWYGRSQGAVMVSEYDLPPADPSFLKFLRSCAELRGSRVEPRHTEVMPNFFLSGKDVISYSEMSAFKTDLKIPDLAALAHGQRIRVSGWAINTLVRAMEIADATEHGLNIRVGVPDGETLVIDFKSGDPAVESRGFHLRFEQPVVAAPWEDFRQYTRAIGGDTPVIVKPHAGSLNRALARAINESKQSSKVATFIELTVGQSITAAPLKDTPGEEAVVREWGEPDVEQMAAYYDVKMESVSSRVAEPFTVFVEGESLKKIVGLCGDDVQLGFSPEPGAPIAVWGNDNKFAVLTAKKKEG